MLEKWRGQTLGVGYDDKTLNALLQELQAYCLDTPNDEWESGASAGPMGTTRTTLEPKSDGLDRTAHGSGAFAPAMDGGPWPLP